MEYIENFDMEQISIFLTNRELGNYLLNGKIEAFTATTKSPVGKRMPIPKLSYLQTGLLEDTAIKTENEFETESKGTRIRSHSLSSFPTRKSGRRRASSLGDLSKPSTQMLLFDLTTTLNDSFPDYDFANSKLEQFTNKEPKEVMGAVNAYFAELTLSNPQFLGKLWTSVDEVANLKRCEIFSFSPDISDDNLYENVWSFHYFFYNKDNKALIYLTCAANRYVVLEASYPKFITSSIYGAWHSLLRTCTLYSFQLSKFRNSVNYISDDEDEDCDDFDDAMIGNSALMTSHA